MMDMGNEFLPRERQMSPAEGFAAEQFAQQDAVRMGIEQMLRMQSDAEQQQQTQMGVTAAGKATGLAFPQVGAGIRSAATSVMAPVKAASHSIQNYVTGGPKSVAAPAAGAAPAGAAAEATSPLGSLWGAAQPYLGAAGTAFNAYQGITSGLEAGASLKEALRSGLLDPEEESKLREDTFDQGNEAAWSGAQRGALSGMTLGPVGAMVGAATGAAGGFAQAARANQGGGISDASAIARWQADPRNEGMGRQAAVDLAKDWAESAGRKLLGGGKKLF